MVFTFIDHRNDVKMNQTLCSETSRLRWVRRLDPRTTERRVHAEMNSKHLAVFFGNT